jgi:hypothetical protein
MNKPSLLFFAFVCLTLLPAALAADQPVSLYPANPHYLFFRGHPIVLITSAEHYGAVINLDFDYVKYLDTLATDGLNYTRIFSGSYIEPPGAFSIRDNTLAPAPGRFIAPWARSGTPGNAHGGNKFDLERWDAACFERLRDFVREAGKRNILVEMTLFCSLYTDAQWGLNPFNPANNVNGIEISDRLTVNTLNNGKILHYQEQLTRKIVQELKDFDNVFYEIQNEPYADLKVTPLIINPYLPGRCVDEWQNRVDLANDAALEWQKRIAEFIVDEETRIGGSRHLIAQNYCNFRYPLRDLDPAISIINFHYAYPEAVLWNFGHRLPISYDESGFLPQSDFVYRKQAWEFMLAGGAIFNNLDYSFIPGHEAGDLADISAPGWGGPAFRKQLGFLKRFLESFEFTRMTPGRGFVNVAPGVTVQALSWPGQQYALYLSGTGPSELRLVLPPGRYQVEWLSPESGSSLKTDAIDHNGGEARVTSPPFAEDIALRITSGVGRL